MTLLRPTTALLVLLASSVHAQYNGPESVEYDPAGDRYFVSNTGSSVIKVRDQAGVVSDFASVNPAPYGLEIMGDTLFACSGGGVKGYLLSTGAQVYSRALGATFCNGITTDGTFLYVTDFSSSRIIKVDVANNSHSTLVSNTAGTPNGIVWDPTGQRLVVAFWGTNAPVKAFDPVTGAATTLVANTGLGNIDGITMDCQGRFLLASWSPDRITRYESNFVGGGQDLGVTGLNNPADIDFDAVNDRICIPNSGNNTVTLFDVDCATGISVVGQAEQRVFPNPVQDLLRFDPPTTTPEPFILLDARGLLIAGGSLQAGALLNVADLAPGFYTVRFARTGKQVRFVKE
jgi:DNA-binding beta-propeller fold protein YncE